MIISEHPQGSEEWLLERSIIPTASEFSNIVTPLGKKSTSDVRYRNELLANWYVGRPLDDYQSEWMLRGNELEGDAAAAYAFLTDTEPQEVGLCYLDDRKLIGASPDRLIGDRGLLEAKCPKAGVLVGYMIGGELPLKYKPQVQGQLWVTRRDWCDFIAYHPDFQPFTIRVTRDDAYIKILEKEVEAFVDKMLEGREKLRAAA